MRIRVFLDTNVFIYAFEFPESNSAKIIELLNLGEIEALVSEQVLKEVTRYFEKFHSLLLARKFRKYILNVCTLVMKDELSKEIADYKGSVKEKDLEQVAATKKYGLKFLISYDRDLEVFEEYVTPRRFLDLLKRETYISEY